MKELNYSPKLPINPDDLAKEEIRKEWFNDQNILVLSFAKAGSPFEIIDVFINEPIPFKDL